MHWLTRGPPDHAGTSIGLSPPAAPPGLTELGPRPLPAPPFPLPPPAASPGLTDEERRTIAEMMAKGTFASINLATNDLDGTFERLQAGDAEVVQEPTEQPYGVRDCAFRDPAGNLIRINERR